MRPLVTLTSLCFLTLTLGGSLMAAPGTPASTNKRVVFESDVNRDGKPLIYTLTLDNPTPAQVSSDPGTHPSITRSGDIYYNRVIHPVWGIITKIYHRQWPGGDELSVTKNELGDEYQPAVSRDGQILAFTTLRYYTPKIGMPHEVIDLLAYKRPFVEQRQLTQSEVVESDPAVDATGKYIYATLTRDGKGEIWRFGYEDAKGERVAGLLEGKLTDCTDPSVDGQNRWCVYRSTRDDNSEIYLLDLATQKETRLTNTEANESEPAMSEDGSKIVFVSDADGDKELYVMDRDGSNVRQLTDNDWDDSSPSVQ